VYNVTNKKIVTDIKMFEKVLQALNDNLIEGTVINVAKAVSSAKKTWYSDLNGKNNQENIRKSQKNVVPLQKSDINFTNINDNTIKNIFKQIMDKYKNNSNLMKQIGIIYKNNSNLQSKLKEIYNLLENKEDINKIIKESCK